MVTLWQLSSVRRFMASLISVLILACALMVKGAPVVITLSKMRSCSGTCCLPKPPANMTTVPLWKPPTGMPIRVRRPASTALNDPVYLAKYKKAYELLRSKNLWAGQVDGHCAYCSGSSYVDVHWSWFFLPWHRWYLYWHERLLGSLINDPTFALPFWDWDRSQKKIPTAYWNISCILYDPRRNPSPANVQAQISSSTSTTDLQQSVYAADDTTTFFGGPLGQGQAGPLEANPHGAVHVAVGRQTDYLDMGDLSKASNDPLFWVHHCNIDRLWWVWKRLPPTPGGNGAPRTEPISTDWLNSQFLFYDEKGKLQAVRVRDAIKTIGLGYTYEDVANPWLPAGVSLAPPTGRRRRHLMQSDPVADEDPVVNESPVSPVPAQAPNAVSPVPAQAPRADPAGNEDPVSPDPNEDPKTQVTPGPPPAAPLTSRSIILGGSPVTVTVGMVRRSRRRHFREAVRDKRGRFQRRGAANQETLIVRGLQQYDDQPVQIQVFINATARLRDNEQILDGYIGSYNHVPNGMVDEYGRPPLQNLQFPVSYYLELRSKKDAPLITVTLVALDPTTGNPVSDDVASVESVLLQYR